MYTQTLQQTFDNEIFAFAPQVPRKVIRHKRMPEQFVFFQSDTGSMVSESEYWDTFYHDKKIRYE